MLFVKLSKFHFTPRSLRVFMMKEHWNLLNAFSASIDVIKSFFFLSMLISSITLIDFQMWSQICLPGVNLNWSWCVIFNILLDSIC